MKNIAEREVAVRLFSSLGSRQGQRKRSASEPNIRSSMQHPRYISMMHMNIHHFMVFAELLHQAKAHAHHPALVVVVELHGQLHCGTTNQFVILLHKSIIDHLCLEQQEAELLTTPSTLSGQTISKHLLPLTLYSRPYKIVCAHHFHFSYTL